jgi:predicted nuclease with TOPRIM domain
MIISQTLENNSKTLSMCRKKDLNSLNNILKDDSISQRQIILRKTLAKLPVSTRDNINSAFRLTVHESDQTKHQLKSLIAENTALKSEIRLKQIEVQSMMELISKLKEDLSNLTQQNLKLQDLIHFKAKFRMASNRPFDSRTKVNDMLVNCLDLLANNVEFHQSDNLPSNRLIPNKIQSIPHSKHPPDFQHNFEKTKLLERKVHEISETMKSLKLENSQLQHNLNILEMSKELTKLQSTTTGDKISKENNVKEVYTVRRKLFDLHDQRFQVSYTIFSLIFISFLI